jgi:hypothetical protein
MPERKNLQYRKYKHTQSLSEQIQFFYLQKSWEAASDAAYVWVAVIFCVLKAAGQVLR